MARTTEQHSDQPASARGEAVTAEHLVHGLIAIANGPDYCMCGATWPCAREVEPGAAQPR